MKLLNYLKNSNVKLSFDLNPWCWSCIAMHQTPTKIDPKLHIWYLRLLPLSIHIVIDDGTWVIPADEFVQSEIDRIEDEV
jgi:hypothetical protein